MVFQINLGFLFLVLIFAMVFIVRYLLGRKTYRRLWTVYNKALQELEDFSAFEFRLGGFSHVSPFPRRVDDEWRYVITLRGYEAEDIVTITHELSECTLGRVIERLLSLEKPLYLKRREEDRFLVHGKRQKYLVEHVMITLGEADNLTPKKLRERLNKEDAEAWLNLET